MLIQIVQSKQLNVAVVLLQFPVLILIGSWIALNQIINITATPVKHFPALHPLHPGLIIVNA